VVSTEVKYTPEAPPVSMKVEEPSELKFSNAHGEKVEEGEQLVGLDVSG